MAKFETEVQNNTINIIGAGTVITGDIQCEGDIRVDGTLKGNLITKGKAVVGPTGFIHGEVNCRNADVSGRTEGKFTVTELLALKATAKIKGEIITSKLSIEPNAVFTGTCNMSGDALRNGQERGQVIVTANEKTIK